MNHERFFAVNHHTTGTNPVGMLGACMYPWIHSKDRVFRYSDGKDIYTVRHKASRSPERAALS
jgi:hypothetical protein